MRELACPIRLHSAVYTMKEGSEGGIACLVFRSHSQQISEDIVVRIRALSHLLNDPLPHCELRDSERASNTNISCQIASQRDERQRSVFEPLLSHCVAKVALVSCSKTCLENHNAEALSSLSMTLTRGICVVSL